MVPVCAAPAFNGPGQMRAPQKCCRNGSEELVVLPIMQLDEEVQTPDGQEQFFYVGGGAIEVQPHLVTVLADTALRAKDIDEAAALAAKQRAEEALKDKVSLISQAEALAELARAAAQLKAIERLRKGLKR